MSSAPDSVAKEWTEILDAELANIRSALEWGLATNRPGAARFACSLAWYWERRRRFAEGRQALDRALRHADVPDVDRMDGLLAAGLLAQRHGDYAAALDRFGSARSLAASSGDLRRLALAANGLGWTHFFLDAAGAAAEAFNEAISLAEHLEPSRHADSLRGLAWARTLDVGDEPGFDLHRQARQLLERGGGRPLLEHLLIESNFLAFSEQRRGEAAVLADRALELGRAEADHEIVAYALEIKATAAGRSGDRDLHVRHLREALDVARAAGVSTEGRLVNELAKDMLARGEVDEATAMIDETLGALEAADDQGASELHQRANLLRQRAGLADDDGAASLAHELYRQAAIIHSGLSPVSHSAALDDLARHLVSHGDRDGARTAWEQSLAAVLGVDESTASDRMADLSILEGDLEDALRHATVSLDLHRRPWPKLVPTGQRRRAGLLLALGRLEEAAEALDEAVLMAAQRPVAVDLQRSHLDRARVRIELGDSQGAHADVAASEGLALVVWADAQLHVATTLARLALLDGRRQRAVDLWSGVRGLRTTLARVPPLLSEPFEGPFAEPFAELEGTSHALTPPPRAALAALRRLIAEEVEALRSDR